MSEHFCNFCINQKICGLCGTNNNSRCEECNHTFFDNGGGNGKICGKCFEFQNSIDDFNFEVKILKYKKLCIDVHGFISANDDKINDLRRKFNRNSKVVNKMII